MATADPDCDISWTLLAAIGRVETNHGRFGGAQLGSDGVSRPEIRGPQLDGAGPFAAIHDSDNGTLDRDKVWDRAVGQMQFLPQTWRSVARDGDGDGTKNPDDIDDSALGSAVYLCGAGGSLADRAGMARAAFRYNHSDYYVSLVLSMQAGFETGVFALPSPPPPPTAKAKVSKAKTPKTKPTRPRDDTKASEARRSPRRSRPRPRSRPSTPKPKPKPTPTPKPTPKPSPQPTPAGAQAGAGRRDLERLRWRVLPRHHSARPLEGWFESTPSSMVGKVVTLKVERQGCAARGASRSSHAASTQFGSPPALAP